jgi:putative membrane protein insertion efficiency factor
MRSREVPAAARTERARTEMARTETARTETARADTAGSSRRPALRRVGAGLVVVLALLLLDLVREPSRQLSAAVLLAGIDVYQTHLSPWSAALGVRCRFEPSCSHYGEAVIRRRGAAVGSWLALGRIVRCGPWTPPGTVDPPP